MSVEIRCTGRDGVERDFSYTQEKVPLSESIIFRIRPAKFPDLEDFFEITVVECNENTYKVVSIANGQCEECHAKGIGDSMLPEISSVLGCVLRSSSNLPKFVGERRVRKACAIWRRLVKRGLAEYVDENDYYRII